MNSPSPILVVLVILWTAAAAAAVITSIVLSVRANRRQTASAAWTPFGPGFPITAIAAIAGYSVAAVATGRFTLATAAFSILWPATAAATLAYAAGTRTRSWPRWATVAFAAAGAVLYGSQSM
ncbi:hypothetical protein E0500_002380 [Streptomyces sp. KM273126]|uniref:hypothetical protein n=1 Tax=Streptomyces sp. KM273126 TaxID=2545247 RepID=UPI00103B55AE|nr:hypothetical protein [Streptomyces sp. KM273126]MBA2806336.1 hypothetical protein [Streptomyces sp. KM273126]